VTIHSRKLKRLDLTVDGESFEAQCKTLKVVNDTDDPEPLYSFGPDGEDREEADDAYTLEATFFADWREGGISDWMWAHDKEVVDFAIVLHPDTPLESVQWAGQVKIKAPDVGGDARTTEETELKLSVIGKPVYTRS
jgi:hypothetical protein